MKKTGTFEIVCAAAIVFLVVVWLKTGANVFPSLVFWSLLLAVLLAGRFQFRYTGWLQFGLIIAIITNATVSWRSGNISALQYAVLMILFLGGVAWMQFARLAETNDNEEESEQKFEHVP